MSGPPKRRRFRFGLRGLILLMTAVCAYFACLEPTKTTGVMHFMQRYGPRNGGVTAVAPLVLSDLSLTIRLSPGGKELVNTTRYYFWFAGWLVELPMTKELVVPATPVAPGQRIVSKPSWSVSWPGAEGHNTR